MVQVVQPVYGADMGRIARDMLGTYKDITGIQQQQKYADIQDKERFAKESSQLAASIRGLTTDEKIQRIQARVADLKERGIPSDTTERLLNMYKTGQEGEKGLQSGLGGMAQAEDYSKKAQMIKEADDAVEQRYQFGLQAGYVKPQDTGKGALHEKLVTAGYKPGTPEYQKAARGILAKSGGPQTVVNLGGADKGKFSEALATSQVKRYDAIQEAAGQAEEQNYTLDELEAMEVQTGALEPLKVQLAAIGESLGADMSSLANVAAGQAYDAKGKKMVLGEMQKQKGPQTESDMKMIAKTVTNLGNTPEANKFIIKSIRAQNLRKVEHRDFMENYLQEKGNLDGASKAWNKYKRDVPMIAKNLKRGGLPMFYSEFEALAREQDPQASREDIISEWKRLDKAAKKSETPKSKVVNKFQPVPLMMVQQTEAVEVGQPQEVIRQQALTGRYGQ